MTKLVSMDVPIDGKKPMFPNGVDVAKDGNVYWTDSSTVAHSHDGLIEVLADGTGRCVLFSQLVAVLTYWCICAFLNVPIIVCHSKSHGGSAVFTQGV